MEGTQQILISEILIDDSFNCREDITKASIFELAAAMEAETQLQEVGVRILTEEEQKEFPGKIYGLTMGFRRTKAAMSLNWPTIRANVQDITKDKAEMLNLMENIHRVDLTFWEECLVVKRFYDKGYSRDKISAEITKSLGWVQRRMQVWQLPVKAQELIKAGVLRQDQIAQLNSYKDKNELNDVLDAVRARYQNSGGDTKPIIKIPQPGAPKMEPVARKVARNRQEIAKGMEFMREELKIPQGIWYGVMAWCSGEINDRELLKRFKDFMKEVYDEDIDTSCYTGIITK